MYDSAQTESEADCDTSVYKFLSVLMKLHLGYELIYEFSQPTPVILVVNIHDSRAADLILRDDLIAEPHTPISRYHDSFGNHCHRIFAPAGQLRLTADAVIMDSGRPDEMGWAAHQDTVQDLPEETLLFLLGSRYCETDLLSETAWRLFSGTSPGHARVQAICDFVHRHIMFDYQSARSTRSANDVYHERVGVCRDYAHLAIAFCRCMNIPARYCTGYLSDIGTPTPHPPGDFAAWLEAWIGGRWYLFDPRNNEPRIGRDLRDARLMPFLTVKHRTTYRYREPVALGEHRMMFRPRESHDLRLIRSSLLISPHPRGCAGCTTHSTIL